MASTPARRRLPPAQRREEILSTATELIAVSGFNGVSLDAFAAACGISKQGLLHHFPSKEHLLVAVLERRDQLDIAAVASSWEPALDAATSRALMTHIVQRNLTQRSLVQLYTVLSAEALDPAHPAHEYFQRRFQVSRPVLACHLFAWHPHPERAVVDVLAFLDGLQLNWLRDPPSTSWPTGRPSPTVSTPAERAWPDAVRFGAP